MIEHPPEFLVEYKVVGMGGRMHFIGRCGDAPIHVGDQFSCLFRYSPRTSPRDLERPASRQQELPVSLRITSIHAYDRSLSSLSEGMTGSLVLDGEGMDQVEPGWVLGVSVDSCVSP
jgi:hypothetical protein